jgi:hypothetical protein
MPTEMRRRTYVPTAEMTELDRKVKILDRKIHLLHARREKLHSELTKLVRAALATPEPP